MFSIAPCGEGSSDAVVPADYHAKTHSLAVLAEGTKAVWLYKFVDGEEKKLELIKKVDTVAVPAACKFLEDGSLLVAFHYSEENVEGQFVVLSGDCAVAKKIEECAPVVASVEEVVKMEKEFECENMKRTIFPRQRGAEDCEPEAKKAK